MIQSIDTVDRKKPVLPPRIRYQSLGKEVGLTFLALFYFVIASNTQAGWLFLLSAFLLGLLGLSLRGAKRALTDLDLEARILGQPQRGRTTVVRLRLYNSGTSVLKQVAVRWDLPGWAAGSSTQLWVVPAIEPGKSAHFDWTVVPRKRGEHRVEGLRLQYGAPFGLFSAYRESPPGEPFLIYPELLDQSARGVLGRRLGRSDPSFGGRRGLGRSRALRSIREYRPGDDLRDIHWKLSARSVTGKLLVQEHFPPVDVQAKAVLDTSRGEPIEQGYTEDPLFERAVSAAATVLWLAHKAGSPCALLLHHPQTGWSLETSWVGAFRALARAQQGGGEPSQWQVQAEGAMREFGVGAAVLVTFDPANAPPRSAWQSSRLEVVRPGGSATKGSLAIPLPALGETEEQ